MGRSIAPMLHGHNGQGWGSLGAVGTCVGPLHHHRDAPTSPAEIIGSGHRRETGKLVEAGRGCCAAMLLCVLSLNAPINTPMLLLLTICIT